MKVLSFLAVLFFVSNAFCNDNQAILIRNNVKSYLDNTEEYLLEKNKDPDTRKQIKNKFDGFNRELESHTKGLKWCKGCELVKTCGNRTCEPDKNENAKNCYEDCVPGLIRSFNKQTICQKTSKVFYPTNHAEGLEIVGNAIKNNQRVKVVGWLHTDTGLICTDGITIATSKMKKIYGLEKINNVETVRAQPGVPIYELVKWLHEHNRSIGLAVVSHRSVTLAGIIGTGAHGTAFKEDVLLSDIIESLKIVKADGNEAEYFRATTPTDLWKSLTLNLGLLGFVTELRIRVQANYNMKVGVSYGPDWQLLRFGGIKNMIKTCDWSQVHWFPSQSAYMKSCGNRTNQKAVKGAQNIMIGENTPEFLTDLSVQIFQAGWNKPWVLSLMAGVRYLLYMLTPPWEKTAGLGGGPIPTGHLVGHSYNMLGSEFRTDKIRNLITKDYELAFSEPNILPALKASREYFRKYNVSAPLIGSLLRFGRVTDKTHLALSAAGKNFKVGDLVMFMEVNHFKPVGLNAKELKAYDMFYRFWVKMMIRDHNARAHWAKNKDWTHKLVKSYGRRTKEIALFQKAIDEMDPNGVFSNRFAKMVGFTWKNPIIFKTD